MTTDIELTVAPNIPEPPKSSKEPSNDKEFLDKIGDNNGYFDRVIKPMLQKGHEGELCKWLQDMNLIGVAQNCSSDSCKNANMPFKWTQLRGVDHYTWKCTSCNKKQSIRYNSCFFKVNCEIKKCMQIILAWCQLIPSETAVNILDLKHHIIRKMYDNLDSIAETYVKTHSNEWVLGGPERIIIVDDFPGGFMSQNYINMPVRKKRNNNCQNILCIAEVGEKPPKMWFHIMKNHLEPDKIKKPKMTKNKNTKMEEDTVETTESNISSNKIIVDNESLQEIKKHVRPGSFIIANKRARFCNYDSLSALSQYKVYSVEYLQKYDKPETNQLLCNLDTIWQTGVALCEELQELSHMKGINYIYVNLWKQRFGTSSNALNSILQHIGELSKFN